METGNPRKPHVVIIGAGNQGLLTYQILKHSTANQVLVVARKGMRGEVARSLGATVLDPTEIDVVEEVKKRTGGIGADLAGKVEECVRTGKVEAYEPVTVRAGTFNTFKILCKGPGYEDTYWSSADYGMFLKTNLRRLPDHPQGPGTQEREVVALNLAR